MTRWFLLLASLSAGVSVAAGALGAHGLRGRLAPPRLDAFEVAVRYQMYHALGLAVTSWVLSRSAGRAAAAAGWLFLGGTGLFCGSLYALSLGGPAWLGAITPVGGLSLLAAWLCLAAAAWRWRPDPPGGGR